MLLGWAITNLILSIILGGIVVRFFKKHKTKNTDSSWCGVGKKGPKAYAQVLKGVGGYRFRIRAMNHEIIAIGEYYKQKQSCLDTLRLLGFEENVEFVSEVRGRKPLKEEAW